jgi:branched-chain amino acid transport system ATP-binding protein
MGALEVILREHRSLAAVINGMVHHVEDIGARKVKPNFEALGAMIYYIDAFPERLHHPKEDRYLFRKLRDRHPRSEPLLARLEEQHREGAERMRVLEQTLTRYQQGGDSEFATFARIVSEYAEFHWAHMRLEESELLPMAKEHLSTDDWHDMDAAFSGNADPLFGVQAGTQFDALYRHIVMVSPPPIGLGRAS